MELNSYGFLITGLNLPALNLQLYCMNSWRLSVILSQLSFFYTKKTADFASAVCSSNYEGTIPVEKIKCNDLTLHGFIQHS